jgi:hypothetical protein
VYFNPSSVLWLNEPLDWRDLAFTPLLLVSASSTHFRGTGDFHYVQVRCALTEDACPK